jgi:hypothetical protein
MRDEMVQREDANPLLDMVCLQLALKTDVALSRALEVAPPVVSKLRHGRMEVGPTLLIRMHEATGLSIKHLKSYLSSDKSERESATFYTIGEIELGINYWRKREPAVNHRLCAQASALAGIYGRMIYQGLETVSRASLDDVEAEAMRLAIVAP